MARREVPRLGLCCTFLEEPIRFRTTTARFAGSLPLRERLAHLRGIVLHNAAALAEALAWCAGHGVGAFRVNSQLMPLATHRELGYPLAAIDGDGAVEAKLREASALAARHRLRLSLHAAR